MSASPDIKDLQTGDALPSRELHIDTVELFLYNAALWNAHRIHFDHPYATQIEGHAGLVIAGPMLGDYLTQVAVEWMGDAGQLLSLEYSNRRVAYIGEVLQAVGKVSAVDRERAEVTVELAIVNQTGEITTPGSAVIRLGRG
jgi:hydroxyacyl-ACP dehydratase HTD2-like protein with hotdog domain